MSKSRQATALRRQSLARLTRLAEALPLVVQDTGSTWRIFDLDGKALLESRRFEIAAIYLQGYGQAVQVERGDLGAELAACRQQLAESLAGREQLARWHLSRTMEAQAARAALATLRAMLPSLGGWWQRSAGRGPIHRVHAGAGSQHSMRAVCGQRLRPVLYAPVPQPPAAAALCGRCRLKLTQLGELQPDPEEAQDRQHQQDHHDEPQ